MKAVGTRLPLPIDHPEALVDVELPDPSPAGTDLLVEIRAVSVNPVDAKVRMRPPAAPGEPRVLGWDASGVVRAAGPGCTRFRAGDEVFYAGALARPGTNAELHLVDERLVGRKPRRLAHADAAALPLTSITAWELLFDRFGVPREGGGGDVLLVVGGAGGVGSMLIQLARALTDLHVIATASRPESAAWCRELGAHDVIDHREPLHEGVRRIGAPQVRYAASLTGTAGHWDALVEALAPQGKLGLIDDPAGPLDVMKLKPKSLSLHWEFMFTRSAFETPDMDAQHRLLGEVADLADAGRIRSTRTLTLERLDADTLRRAHAAIETGRTIGKIVVEAA